MNLQSSVHTKDIKTIITLLTIQFNICLRHVEKILLPKLGYAKWYVVKYGNGDIGIVLTYSSSSNYKTIYTRYITGKEEKFLIPIWKRLKKLFIDYPQLEEIIIEEKSFPHHEDEETFEIKIGKARYIYTIIENV